MTVDLKPDLEARLRDVAERQSLSVPQLTGRGLLTYVESLEDDSARWVRTTQARIRRTWPPEDFSNWGPPSGT